MWVYTPKGKFTVSSTYKLAVYDFAEGCMEGLQMGKATNLFGEESRGYICQLRRHPLPGGCVATSFPRRPICTIGS